MGPEPGSSEQKRGFLRRVISWLFSQRYFHFKLLSGTAAGVVVILLLAGIFLYVTLHSNQRDLVRSHATEIMRLSSRIENDIDALEAAHRGFLLTGKPLYVNAFESRLELVKRREGDLDSLILDNPRQRTRLMKARADVQKWVDTIALPQIRSRQAKNETPATTEESLTPTESVALGNSLLDQVDDVLQSLQDEEQIALNQRMAEEEWAEQSNQILDFLPKLERSIFEMQKEKRGFLLTGQSNFEEAYRRAVIDFYTYNGYLSILLATAPGQAELLAEVRSRVEGWITRTAAPEMDAKRAGQDAITIASSNNGEDLMGSIRDMLANLEKQESSVYEVRSAAASRQRIIETWILGCLAFFAVVLLVISNSYSFVLVRRQLAKLKAAEARIRAIIQNILDGMITVDGGGIISSTNPAAEKMFGYHEREMVGQKFTKLVPRYYGNDPNAKPLACSWREMATRTGHTTLAQGRTSKLVSFPLEISLSQMEVGSERFYVAMLRDVKERKRFETEIASEKESLAVTLRSIGDGVITTDIQGKIIILNNEAERLIGWPSGQAIGKPLRAVFNVAADPVAQARSQQSGARSEAESILACLSERATLISRDGTARVIEQTASPIRSDKNEVTGVVLVFRDITQRQRDEAERRKAETLEQLGLLAGGIAHDFNNLLTAIIGNISLASLLLPPDGEMVARLVDAKNASMRARDLAQQLLTFARGGAPIKQTASIGKLIQDTVGFSLRGTHSRSEFQFGADLWPAEIDPGQISQVIGNLVMNADQAMPDGGTLHVSCENFRYTANTTPVIPDLLPGDYIRIQIRDEGVGIPEQNLKRIFDPYFTTKAKGNGLGLATTYSVVKNHNGLITVESQLHVGSTFTVFLPAALHQEMPLEQPRPMPPRAITGSGRVLIVDDEESVRTLVHFTLTRLGYDVATAETALKGVDLYREKFQAGERFDAVILDLTLPGGMGGKEALKRLIEIDPTVNAIVSSGYATDATMSRYQDFGFRGVIAKPYEASELGKIVHDVIANQVNVVADYAMRAAG